MLEKNNIYLGDALNLLKEIDDKSIDLILTDIPYGEVNRESNGLRELDRGCADVVDFSLSELLKDYVRVCKGSMYIFCGTEQVSEIRKILVQNNYSTRLLIWEKTNPSPMNGDKIWLSGIECCVYGKLSGATFKEHCKNCVLRFPSCSDKDRFHATQKPKELFKYIITVSSNENDLILDTFSGSATTAIAALELKRNFICIEKDENYYKKSVERLNRAKMKKRLF